MGDSNRNPKGLLDELSNFMAEEAETITDEELLEEAAQTGELARVAGLRKAMSEGAAKIAAGRLAAARSGYQAALAAQVAKLRPTPPPFSVLKIQVQALFAQESDLPLAAAWRNGEYQSESDLQGLWYELYDLGVIRDEAQ
jgi:hypothetical protein